MPTVETSQSPKSYAVPTLRVTASITYLEAGSGCGARRSQALPGNGFAVAIQELEAGGAGLGFEDVDH
ncbi:hypothetical protein NN4_32650 [Nocardia ninae NBRC 108245]|uniref:Uncharacterized protein n=1 Tax=Nocardia ninae NBRC 108245 TaxID=1210091 RepID=A0A511MFS4_9NOCA|nr:hypothetical protein NN4_32650 [Nocardia ninae NBRC 108245]